MFLILVDKNTTEESWQLKRKKEIIAPKIKEFLDDGPEEHLIKNLEFSYGKDKKKYRANCCILFILENAFFTVKQAVLLKKHLQDSPAGA